VEGIGRDRGADLGVVDVIVLHAQTAGGAVAEDIDPALPIEARRAAQRIDPTVGPTDIIRLLS
jgi:hypothetical protein